jgi:hypothetical protein
VRLDVIHHRRRLDGATNAAIQAPDFHTPSHKLAEARTQLAETREHLSEALEQQSATSEVLKVFSRSAFLFTRRNSGQLLRP